VADYALIREPIRGLTRSNRFYFDIGTREWNYYVPFVQKLKNEQLTYGRQIYYYEVAGGAHSTDDWVRRIQIPFMLFLNNGTKSGFVHYELQVECIPSIQTAGLYFQRLNITANFDDGVIYTVTTEADFEILEGKGQVTDDGRFAVEEGEMQVRVSYKDWSIDVELTDCN
jgi:hypothetical protein